MAYDNWEDDKDLCKLLDEIEKEEAEKRADPELNVSWEYLMIFSNWLNWLGIVKKKDRLMHEIWSDLSECLGCRYLDEKNAWCRSQKTPAAFDPFWTPRAGMTGIACMGMGKEVWTQLNLFCQPEEVYKKELPR